MEGRLNRCKSQWSTKYRSRPPSKGTCGVRTLNTMQGLMVVGLRVEEILNVDVKCVKGTGAQNIGQGHGVTCPVSTCRRSTMQGLVARGLIHLRRSGTLT